MRFHNRHCKLFLTCALFVSPLAANAQNPTPTNATDPESKPNKTVIALERIQKEFALHQQLEKQMQDQYRELESRLKKTEDELQRINTQGMQQQLAAMQAAMQSMQANANLQRLAGGPSVGSPNNGNNNANNDAVRNFAQMQLMQNQMLQRLDATLRASQLSQLDANAQVAVRNRIQTIQEAVKLEQAWTKWQQESVQFYFRYWPHSDPEKRLSPQELEAALAVLDQRHLQDVGAKLVAVNLMANSGNLAEALASVNEVINLQTQLQGVAMMEKAKIFALLEKEKESKQAYQAAIKLDKENPYLRWIRYEIAALQDQDPIAETELRFLTTLKEFEIEARRSLALLHAKRSKKSPGEGKRAIKEAVAAMDLEAAPDWYSHFVMAVAYAAGRDIDSAKDSLAQAETLASQEQRERLEKLKESWDLDKQ